MALLGLSQQNLNPTTGGSTTPSTYIPKPNLGLPMGGGQNFPSTTPTQYSTNGTVNMGLLAKTPQANVSAPSTSLPSNQTSGIGSYKGVTINPGNQSQINAQVASINSGQNGTTPAAPIPPTPPAITPNTSTGSGTGGGQAPAGMSYNAQGQLVPTSTLGGTNNFGTAVGTLSTTAGAPSAQYTQAETDYNTAKQNLANIQQQEANQVSNINGMGTNLSRAGGLLGNVQNLAANSEDVQTGLMNAANTQLGAATNQQSTQQSGQQQAASLLSPTLGQYGQAQYSPTGGLVGGGTGAAVSPSDPFYQTLQTYAQALESGQGSAIPSSVTGNPALQAQLLQMAKTINSNFNYNTATGEGSAQTSNAATAGTASTSANLGIYQQQLTSAANTLQQAQAIQSSGTQLISTMQSLGINPSDSTYANSSINSLKSQFSSPAYATFNANIANLQSKVSSLLSAGEIPTSATAAANSIVNGDMTLSGLSAAITQINSEASQLAQSQLSTASLAFSNIQSNSGSNNSTSGGWASLGD